jgi:4-amino-4-deoxy-L-arabinose transferase-like glycosyltransferase
MLNTGRKLPLAILIFLAGVVYLIGNTRVSLWDRDEPRYAMASRWMLKSGDWVVPHIGWGVDPTEPRTAKPPMVYWLQATAMKFFGPTAFAARLPSSVAMVLTLVLLAGVLAKFFPEHAFWTVLILGSSVLFIVAAKMCIIDSILLFWVMLCQICLYAMWRGNYSWAVVLIFAVALGLAGLAKGPIVLGVLGATVLVLWLFRFLPNSRELPIAEFREEYLAANKVFVTILIVAAINVPWLVLVAQRSPGFLSRIVGHDVIQRMHEPLEGHKGPPGFYLLTIFGTFYPWSLLLPMTIAGAWRNRREPAVRFALAATIGPWLMFECISTKMVHYLLPVFPPLAFLVADAIVRCLRGERNDLGNRAAQWGFSIWAIITTAGATALLLPDRWFMQTPLWPGLLMTFAGLAYAIVVLSLIWKQKPRAGMLAMGIGFAVLAVLLFAFYLPTASFLRISPNLAAILNSNHAADARMNGYEEESLAFYDHGIIDDLPGKTLHEPPSAWPRWLVITADRYQRLPPTIKGHFVRVGEVLGINYSKSIRPLDVLVVKKSR